MQSSSIPCKELESLRNCAFNVSLGRSRDAGSEVTTNGIAKVGRVRRITRIIYVGAIHGQNLTGVDWRFIESRRKCIFLDFRFNLLFLAAFRRS